jgi:glycosyltransferase involved in cell wall biosynthesis
MPLKVMVLSHIREVSGAEIVTLNLFRNNPELSAVYVGPAGDYAEAFRREGHEVHTADELLHHRIADEGPLWYPMFPIRLLRATNKIRQVLESYRPDSILVIHAYDLLFLWGLSRGAIPGITWVCHAIYQSDTRMTPLVASVSQRAQQIVAVSCAVRDRLVELGLDTKQIRLVHNAVDAEERFNPDRITSTPLPGAALRVGILGRLYPFKGIHIAVDAIRSRPFMALYVVGDPWPGNGGYVEELKRKAGPNTHFLGPRQDIPEFLKSLDVVLVPSVGPEAFGMTALEGMAMAKTVVASRIGGLPEIIRHGETGYLFRPGDSTQLGQLLDELAEGTLPHTGPAARASVLESFALKPWQARMSEILRR